MLYILIYGEDNEMVEIYNREKEAIERQQEINDENMKSQTCFDMPYCSLFEAATKRELKEIVNQYERDYIDTNFTRFWKQSGGRLSDIDIEEIWEELEKK